MLDAQMTLQRYQQWGEEQMIFRTLVLLGLCIMFAAAPMAAAPEQAAPPSKRFTADRVFDIEYASDPQVSPDGSTIVYVRRSMDRLTDRNIGQLWSIDVASGAHRPMVIAPEGASAPRWSPDGSRLVYSTSAAGKPQLNVFYPDTGRSHTLAQFLQPPSQPVWSPDGRFVAFSMFVASDKPAFAKAPPAPEGSNWSDPVRVFDQLTFRFDGQGYLKYGTTQIFVLPAEGGTPRQVTFGDASLGNPEWLGRDTLLVTGNLSEDRDHFPIERDIYAVSLADLSIRQLTTRLGPDHSPVVSPDGTTIAFRGYDDEVLSYQQDRLFVMSPDGSNVRQIAPDFPGNAGPTLWAPDGRSLLVLSQDYGVLSLFRITLDGRTTKLVTNIGGTSIGRPYAAGSFSVSSGRRPVIAYTAGFSDRPAEVAVAAIDGRNARVLTALNDDILPYLEMARTEEIKIPSRHDGLEIHAWVALPPDFRADGSFPMILEIHGGPYAMYGPFFSSELHRYAAEGYVTVWANPRGSTGYGEAFAQAIDRAYPGYDYEDLMTVVDHLVARNYVSADRLFVTGGSGGGILTAWIVTRTDRFAAAASIKPVINWLTMALTADIAQLVRRHWIREDPWSNPEAFLERSPIRYADRVKTPTLLLVGEEDWRTPSWEAEQFYTALKMLDVDTALIRVPGASHDISGRPSRLIAQTDNVMGWFAKHDPARQVPASEASASD